jgi:hypothetical protein
VNFTPSEEGHAGVGEAALLGEALDAPPVVAEPPNPLYPPKKEAVDEV